jgi:predicted nicotinamide N-methyase
MSCLSSLMSSELPSETTAVQQKSYVTFTTLPENASREEEEGPDPTMTLLERRQLISGSLTTGFRTWEAALHLGAYLLSGPGQELVKDKSILELGAGTGFLAILCAKNLGAAHVTTTDGDEGVVEALKENLFLNGLDDERKVLTSVLRWGQGVRGSWVQDDLEEHPYDTVIGADIVSEQCDASVLQHLTDAFVTDVRQGCFKRIGRHYSHALRSSTNHQSHHRWCDTKRRHL